MAGVEGPEMYSVPSEISRGGGRLYRTSKMATGRVAGVLRIYGDGVAPMLRQTGVQKSGWE